ncbi:hypothetical protein ACFL0L_02365 [Patescibacteria group bacterium]
MAVSTTKTTLFIGGVALFILLVGVLLLGNGNSEQNEGVVAGISFSERKGISEKVAREQDGEDYLPTTIRKSVNEVDHESAPVEEDTEPSFSDYYTVAYLGSFSGSPEPPIQTTFSEEDKIVLVTRATENNDTDKMLYARVYKDNELIFDSPPIEILGGEIGLINPSKKGEYTVRMVVDDQVIYELPFTIE